MAEEFDVVRQLLQGNFGVDPRADSEVVAGRGKQAGNLPLARDHRLQPLLGGAKFRFIIRKTP